MPKECITLNVGQAGTSIGQNVWELFCAEHEILPDGTHSRGEDVQDDTYLAFFNPTAKGQYVPRACFIDTDPRSRDAVLQSEYRQLFHRDNVLGWNEDSKNNFFYGSQQATQNKYVEEAMDRVRVLFDACDNLQGFLVFNSYGGGTGTGLCYKLLEQIADHFQKNTVFQSIIYPSKNLSSCIVEPYNCIFAMHYMKDLIDVGMVIDNEKAYKVVSENLQIANPDFLHLNQVIAQFISSCTTSLRFESELNASLPEIDSNLRPFPEYKYPILSLAPLRGKSMVRHELFTTEEIIMDLFQGKNILADCSDILNMNRYLSCVVLLRGTVEVPVEGGEKSASGGKLPMRKGPIPLNEAMWALRNLVQPKGPHRQAIKFHPCFSSGGFKVGVVSKEPVIPKSMKDHMATTQRQGAMLGNTTAVRQLFVRQYTKFLHLFFHKAYVWQFLEADGEMDAFYEAKEGVRSTIDKYESMLDACCQQENEKGGGASRVEGKAVGPQSR
jgi:tubulin alpha